MCSVSKIYRAVRCAVAGGGGGDLSQVMACGGLWSLRYVNTLIACHDTRGGEGSSLGSLPNTGHSLRAAANQFIADGGEGKQVCGQRGGVR